RRRRTARSRAAPRWTPRRAGPPRRRRRSRRRGRRRPTCGGTSRVTPPVLGAEASGRTVTPGPTAALRKCLDLGELGALEALDHQLGDPVAAAQLDRLARVVVDQQHLDLAAV